MPQINRTMRVLAILVILAFCTVNMFARKINTTHQLGITTTSLPAGTVGTPYSATLGAKGGTSPYTWTITSCSGACNAGLSASTSGVLAGTPANAGTSTIAFTVTDAVGTTATTSLAITIGSGNTTQALGISTASLPAGTVGTSYSATLAASGGTAPNTWSITSCSGSCNTGLSVSTSGVLAGTPANAGTSTFAFMATDAAGTTATTSLAITIASSSGSGNTPQALGISTASFPAGTVGTSYTANLAASGGTAPYTWSITSCSGSCNTGLGWSTTGVLSGTPANAGTSTFAFMATDAAGTTATKSLTLTIGSGTTSTPVAVSVSPTATALNTGQTQQFSASVSGTTNTGINWQVNGVTGGNATYGTISTSGLYTAPATAPSSGLATVTAVSSYQSTASASATVSIAAAGSTNPPPATANYYASPSGSGTTCSASSPCSLDVAFSKASAGQTVQAAAGTYSYGGSAFTMGSSGAAGSYKTLTCVTRGACKITNSVTGNATVVYITGNYVALDGFEVTNSGSGNNLGFFVTGSNVRITRNTIHHIETDCGSNGGGGIQLANGVSNIVMDSNLIYDISWTSCYGQPSVVQTDGILAETTGSGIQITNNVVYHVAGGWGILYGNSSGNSGSAVISNNTVFSNANGGIAVVNGGDYSTISNNVVLNNGVVSGQCGIWTIYAADSHILMAGNDVYGNTGGNFCPAGSPIMSGNISVNPAAGTTFVNWQPDGSGNYQELSSSPTRVTGTTSCASGSPAYITPGACAPAHDYMSNPRNVNTGWDMGAYQYQ